MQKGTLVFSTVIVVIILSVIAMNNVVAQPPPESNKFLPSPPSGEVCYGYGNATGTIEFVCKDENYHYRAIDCDDINEDTRECHSDECTITIGDGCARIRGSYEQWSNNEPLCYPCTSISAPVYN
jgi:hypothetical protein